MDATDIDLRERHPGPGAIIHLLANRRVLAVVVFGESGLFASQQRLGGAAIAAARTGIDFDGGRHGALGFCEYARIIWELWGYPQPGQRPARRPVTLLPGAALARRHPGS